jgi:hypothetical protein
MGSGLFPRLISGPLVLEPTLGPWKDFVRATTCPNRADRVKSMNDLRDLLASEVDPIGWTTLGPG